MTIYFIAFFLSHRHDTFLILLPTINYRSTYYILCIGILRGYI